MIKGIISGALFIGILSAIPVVSIGNCCCCLWVVLGGLLAGYLARDANGELTAGNGFMAGAGAGAGGAVIYTILALILGLIMVGTGANAAIFDYIIKNLPPDIQRSIPPEVMMQMNQPAGAQAGSLVINTLVGGAVYFVIFAIIAGIGGLLGTVFFKRKV